MKRPTPQNPADFGDAKVIERPDGYYVQDSQTGNEDGPYATFPEAVAGMESNVNIESESVVDLKEVEEELGIADWIDPDTGALAEESVPHIEDH